MIHSLLQMVIMITIMLLITWTSPRVVVSFTTPSSLYQPRLSPSSSSASSSLLQLRMVPKYIGNKWIPQTPEDMPSAGYDTFGTFIRHGPKPTLTRIFSPDDYEQAILKFMVTDQCDYITAQGNMDAYLRNPPDWQYQRMEDMKNGYEKQRDYVTIQVKDIVLVLTWSTIVVAVIARLIYSITNGVDFVSTTIGI